VGKTIGEGTFGKVKCWGRGTPLMLFDGRVKNVEDIVAGDRLMGDDSTVRVVREGSVVRGTGPMWSIRSADPTRLAWQCNELHILVVKFNQPPSAVKSRQAARLPYFFRTIEMVTDDTTVSGLRVRGRTLSFASRAEAQVRRDALAATVWQPLVWECTPPELLACPRWVQRAASMFQPSLVHFPPLRGDLRHTMEKLWKRPLEEQDILDTAWVLGLWLSSGSDRKLLGHNPSVEFEHSTLGLQMVAVAATNSGIIQSHCDEAVLRKWEAWHAMAYKDMHDGSAGANFDMLLAALELRSSDDHSKLLPQVLLQESVNVRRHLLAGLLDGAGTYDAQRRLYEVSLSPLKSLREAVVHLMRGLGFVTGGGAHAVDEEGTSRTDPHDSTCSLRVTMSGEHMELLPLVQESKRAHAAASAASSWSDVDVRCQGFTCTPVGSGDFFGFELEGGSSNRRCLLGDFVVSHNSGIHKLTGLPVAIKILEKERIVDLADVERVKREIHILTRVRHPNVIRLYEVIDSPRHIFLIMEFVKGGELFDYIVKAGRVQDEQACRIFHHILNGVDYVHNKNIIHRSDSCFGTNSGDPCSSTGLVALPSVWLIALFVCVIDCLLPAI
jgi:5'-AMP-activated protein kinase catalytic alpha subunit